CGRYRRRSEPLRFACRLFTGRYRSPWRSYWPSLCYGEKTWFGDKAYLILLIKHSITNFLNFWSRCPKPYSQAQALEKPWRLLPSRTSILFKRLWARPARMNVRSFSHTPPMKLLKAKDCRVGQSNIESTIGRNN